MNLELILTSRADVLYTVETADVSGDEIVFQRSSAEGPRRFIDRHGVLCCSTARQVLSTNPIEVATHLYLRPEPGDYSLFVKTKRVSRGKPDIDHHGEGTVLTSDMLQLTIVRDEK